jgi:hypothetical protein
MRVLPVVLLVALSAAPLLLSAEALPTEAYVAVDAVTSSRSHPDPFAGFEDYAMCFGPATLQVQRNAIGSWDVLIRRGAVAPAVTPNYPTQTNLNSIERCPFESGRVLTITGATGSPAQGIAKTSGNSYYGWTLSIEPFTLGGPTVLEYEEHCSQYVCGVGYSWQLVSAPLAMG